MRDDKFLSIVHDKISAFCLLNVRRFWLRLFTISISRRAKNGGDAGDAFVCGDNSIAHGGDGGESVVGLGGTGGEARVFGNRSVALGGQGGRGGIGPGGPGGDAMVDSDDMFRVGGQGGEANQADGRGGRGGLSYELSSFGLPRHPHMRRPYGEPNYEPGRGGDAPDTPQYKARRLIIEDLKARYFNAKPLSSDNIWYDRVKVSTDWLNEQLLSEGHRWRVSIEADEYTFEDGA